MTRIDQSNIEELWQRFLDCQLSETEEAELMAYLESNPDVMAMLENSDIEDVKFEKKEMLSIENITERLLIEKLEGIISEEDEKYIDTKIKTNQNVNKSYEAYKLTIQKPDLDVHYPDKDSLKKRGIVFWLRPVSIAASIIIIATCGIILYNVLGNGGNVISNNGQNDIPQNTSKGTIADVQTDNAAEKKLIGNTDNSEPALIEEQKLQIRTEAHKNTNVTAETLAFNSDTIGEPTLYDSPDIAETELDSIATEDDAPATDERFYIAEQNTENTDSIENIEPDNPASDEDLLAYQSENNGVTIIKESKFRTFLRRSANKMRSAFKDSEPAHMIRDIGNEICLTIANNKK
ncbi:MAG: hypothetical protein J5709_06020 [Bacteroidales bacterium]|nr:hypothetical protein [Bacteroidales bacterium]